LTHIIADKEDRQKRINKAVNKKLEYKIKMEKFKTLGVSEELLKKLGELNFHNPTEIQEKSIPLVIEGKDVIAGAATGSGKTLAFGAGIIKQCDRDFGIQALVLVPTRELAEQVALNLKKFSEHKKLKVTAIYGGVSINPQIEELEDTQIVVGTPGRILDHLQRKTINLQLVKVLVLDEADRMLDMGFIDDVEKIIQACPKNRQTLLFSATIQGRIGDIAEKYMNNPTQVFAEEKVDPTKLEQVFYDVEDNQKFSLLVHLLKQDHSGLVMVFCNTQKNTDFVAKNLRLNGIHALAIHGGYSQNKRSQTMEKFHDQDFQVLICTDVAARGLDIKGISHVYNYDAPNEENQYVHRIGRTARAGKEGKAINILGSRDYENFARVKRQNPNIQRQETPEFKRAEIGFKPDAGRGFRGRDRGGRRFGNNGGRFSHGNRSFHRRSNSHSGSGGFRGRRDDRRDDRRGDSRHGNRHSSFRRDDRRSFRHNRHERHSRF
jgi:ATP-dependent RNA helicase DeaD